MCGSWSSTATCAGRCPAPGHDGPRVPYGIGAKLGDQHRPVSVFAGDGAMQVNSLAELITVRKYWHEWADPRLVVYGF